MAKKSLAVLILMCCTLGLSAQSKIWYLVESADSITALADTRNYVGYLPSGGRIATIDILVDCLIRGHENDYVVVSKIDGSKAVRRTWCRKDKISTRDLLVKSLTSTKEEGKNAVLVEFTNGEKWVTTDTRWSEALPGQKVKVTKYDGETYMFTSYQTDGSVDQELHRQLAMN